MKVIYTNSELKGENDRLLILGTNTLKRKEIHSGDEPIHCSSKNSQLGYKHHGELWIDFNREILRVVPMLIF